MFYGVPETSGGLPGSKIARHDDDGARIDPERLDDRLHPEDVEPIERFAGAYAPRLLGRLVGHRACMYTLSADQHFIVGRASELTNLVVCGGLSGHGFKFAPVLGELVAGLVCDGNPPPVEFSCARLGL
jgi:glycine/D-amino acid oxidase-like deaminating enzyme